MKNEKIRKALINKNMKHYELAKELNTSEATLCRWLRYELPEDKQKEILNIIEKWRPSNE